MLRNSLNKWTKKSDPSKNSMFFSTVFLFFIFYFRIYDQTNSHKWKKAYFGLLKTFVGSLDIDFSHNLTKIFSKSNYRFLFSKIVKKLNFPLSFLRPFEFFFPQSYQSITS